MVRKFILGVLLLVLVTNVASAETFAYVIDPDLENVYPAIDIPAYSTSTIYAKMEAGYAPSVPDYAFELDDSSDYATLSPYDWSQEFAVVFSIERTNDLTATYETVMGNTHEDTGWSNGWNFAKKSDETKFRLYVQGNYIGTGFTIDKNQITDVVIQSDGVSSVELWKNGEKVDDISIGILDSALPLTIGMTPHDIVPSMEFKINNVYHFNRQLSSGEIDEYRHNKKLTGSGLVSFYSMDNSLVDSVGDNDGTNHGGIWSETYGGTADVSTTVTDMGGYFKIEITNHESTSLTDYPAPILCNQLGITSSVQSVHFTDVDLAEPVGPEPDEPYNPTLGGRYSQYIDTIFPYDGEISAWAMIANVVTVWTTHVGEDVFWLFVLPLPILAYWIKTKSVELPVIVYLVLGGMFYGLAPDVMQTPARIMLMFGVTGMIYHFFKNRG